MAIFGAGWDDPFTDMFHSADYLEKRAKQRALRGIGIKDANTKNDLGFNLESFIGEFGKGKGVEGYTAAHATAVAANKRRAPKNSAAPVDYTDELIKQSQSALLNSLGIGATRAASFGKAY